MKASIIDEKEAQKYNEFVLKYPLGSIHQTYEWGIFQSKSAHRDKFWVVVLEDDTGHLVASALIIRQKMSFGTSWLYCPRGPLVDYTNEQHCKLLLEKIAAIAKEEKAIFFRFDPALQPHTAIQSEVTEAATKSHLSLPPTKTFPPFFHSRPAHAHYQPEHTLIVDLTPEPERILAQMKPKGRYNIKVAQKHGVKIRISQHSSSTKDAAPPIQDIKNFYDLLCQTTARDSFSGHPVKYYQEMLEIFAKKASPSAKLYLAEYQDKVVAGAIVTYFQDTATYYFGASSNEYRNVMAPYFLHWQIMQDARAAGYKQYDLFGIAPPDEPTHAWSTVTAFKLKFGGTHVEYLPAQEIIYKPFWYFFVKMAKRGRGLLQIKK